MVFIEKTKLKRVYFRWEHMSSCNLPWLWCGYVQRPDTSRTSRLWVRVEMVLILLSDEVILGGIYYLFIVFWTKSQRKEDSKLCALEIRAQKNSQGKSAHSEVLPEWISEYFCTGTKPLGFASDLFIDLFYLSTPIVF